MYGGRNYRGRYRRNYRNENYERGRSRSRERQYPVNTRRNGKSSSSRSRSGSRASTNREIIRYKCGEYDHFAKDCLTLKLEKEAEQIQQMYNMDEEKTSLKTLATDTYESLNSVSSINEMATDHLNL